MYSIGIDLGGTAIKAGIVDKSGNIIVKDKVPTKSERGYEAVLRDMAKLCKKLIEKAGMSENDIEKIGVGCPGTPDKVNGILIYNNNLGMRNVNIRKELQKYFLFPYTSTMMPMLRRLRKVSAERLKVHTVRLP